MRTNGSDLFGKALGNVLKKGTTKDLEDGSGISKSGTSRGAELGWMTRRGHRQAGGEASPVKGHATPETIKMMVDGLKTVARVAEGRNDDLAEAANHLLEHGLESEPKTSTSMTQEARITEARRLLDMGMEMGQAAIRASQDGNPPAWLADISEAVEAHDEQGEEKSLSGVLFGKMKVVGAFPATQGEAIEKAGTKAGAERGWETRRGRAPVEDPKGEGKRSMGENFLLQPGSGEKFMDNLKAAPAGTTIRDGSGLIQHRKKGDNEWEWLNPTTGKVIMVGDDNSVFQAVRAATTSEAPRKTPAWPSTGHGSPGHKGEAWSMQGGKESDDRTEVRRLVRLAERSSTPEGSEEAYREIGRIMGVEEVTPEGISRFLAKPPTLDKVGTSDGAKLGWETRRRGAVPEEPGGGKTYPVIYRPGGEGTFGEVRRVTVPPREEEPEGGKSGEGKPKIPISSVNVETRKHKFSTGGKEPRGRGTWAFQIGDKMEMIPGDYAEAKGKAVRMAAERGEREVEVLP